MRVTFLHPDLGIGGAERLVVDAATALSRKGHDVTVVTNQFDPSHSFQECKQLKIVPVLMWLPKSLFSRFYALCAYIKMVLAAIYTVLFIESDVLIADQISACLIILRLFSHSRLIFYCHYPDLLLTDREGSFKSIYRKLIDWVEASTVGLAHVICVNSNFTASVVRRTFPHLAGRRLEVLYPSLNTKFFDMCEGRQPEGIPEGISHLFVSLNRFERKKKIELAIDSFIELSKRAPRADFEKCLLVIAGGYDRRNEENLVYHRQLKEYALTSGINSRQFLFLRSPSDEQKMWLLRKARAVLYTPSNEHFGIVPLEGMYMRTPVIAVRSGGPVETIIHRKTGFLVEPNPKQFAECMCELVESQDVGKALGELGRKRVIELFSFESFGEQLDSLLCREGQGDALHSKGN